VISLAAAVNSSNVPALGAVMAFGFLLGVVGHIVRSRTLIVTGIVIIAAVSAYFAFVVGKLR